MAKNPELPDVLRELYHLTGFRMTVFDRDFQKIEAYPAEVSAFCRLIQQSGEGKRCCHENDWRAFETVRASQEVYLYRCRFGLCEAVAPLQIMGNTAGYLMMGQSAEEGSGALAEIVERARPFVRDEAALRAAAAELTVCGRDKILSCLTILDICAQYISLNNRFLAGRGDVAGQVGEYLERNFAAKITVDEVCKRFLVSRTTVMAAFKKRYGMGMMEYLAGVRVRAARQLLQSTKAPVREVAERCGYADQNYFTKVFAKHCGKTPVEYRRGAGAAKAAE